MGTRGGLVLDRTQETEGMLVAFDVIFGDRVRQWEVDRGPYHLGVVVGRCGTAEKKEVALS